MLYGKLAYSNATLQITGRLGADIRESLQRPAEPNRWGGDVQCSVGPLSMGNVHLEFPSELDILISATAENSAAADMRDDLLDIRSWVMRGDVTPLADLE